MTARSATGLLGVYPGSFNPPTVAHLGIARAARARFGLERVDLAISVRALEKEHVERPLLADRLAVLEALARRVGWLGVKVTEAQLLADIAEGYDVLVMGADKWHQVLDVRFYGGSTAARDAALARLPRLAIAPRPPLDVPAEALLDVDAAFADMSSTQAREGAADMMVPEAAAFDRETGAWTDPPRYERWLAARAATPPASPPGD
jgi:nicotinic acid mononucleotide adenylyltransferase